MTLHDRTQASKIRQGLTTEQSQFSQLSGYNLEADEIAAQTLLRQNLTLRREILQKIPVVQ